MGYQCFSRVLFIYVRLLASRQKKFTSHLPSSSRVYLKGNFILSYIIFKYPFNYLLIPDVISTLGSWFLHSYQTKNLQEMILHHIPDKIFTLIEYKITWNQNSSGIFLPYYTKLIKVSATTGCSERFFE